MPTLDFHVPKQQSVFCVPYIIHKTFFKVLSCKQAISRVPNIINKTFFQAPKQQSVLCVPYIIDKTYIQGPTLQPVGLLGS